MTEAAPHGAAMGALRLSHSKRHILHVETHFKANCRTPSGSPAQFHAMLSHDVDQGAPACKGGE